MKHSYLTIAASLLIVLVFSAPTLASTKTSNGLTLKTWSSPTGTSASSAFQVADAMPDFGSPPSGEIPILYNDRHVYANPDTLRQGRVLAALVKNGQLLVPLRSMFEQMGATVSYDATSKSVKATKPGSEVQVTLGKNEVLINGESRPLDVPPMMYKGVLLVPVRVISEALGAYVQWVPEQHLAVVRYIPPTPVPTPSPPPTPAPTPVPTPVPTVKPVLGYLQGGYAYSRDYNAYANGTNSNGASYVAAGAFYFGPMAFKVDWRQDQYPSSGNSLIQGPNFTQFNTIDGGSATIPKFIAKSNSLDGRLEYQILKPKIMLGIGYIQLSNNFGYPNITAGGVGLEKLPDFEGPLGWYGSFFYYPNTRGIYTVQSGPNAGVSYTVAYYTYKADIGLDYTFANPFYVYLGYSGDRMAAKQAAPISETHSGPYIGLGFKF